MKKVNKNHINIAKGTQKNLIERSSSNLVKRGLSDITRICVEEICTESIYENRIKESYVFKRNRPIDPDGKESLIKAIAEIGIIKEVASIIGDALNIIGIDGVIDIERGIRGNGYSLEQLDCSNINEPFTLDAAISEIEKLKKQIENTYDEIEKQKLKRHVAEIAHAIVVIRINCYSNNEYFSKKKYLDKAIWCAREIVNRCKR
jgi:transposase-like protein